MKKGFKSLWLKGMQFEGEALRKIFLLSVLASLFQLALPLGIQALMGFITGGEFRIGTISIILLVLLATWMANRWQVQMIQTGEHIEERLFVLMAYEYAQRLSKEVFKNLFPNQNISLKFLRFKKDTARRLLMS